MTRGNALACALTLVAAMFVTPKADAQWGRSGRWRQGQGWGRGYGPGWYGRGLTPGGRYGRGSLFGPRMAYALGITNAQQEAINQLYLKAVESADPLWQELDQTEIELSRLSASAKSADSAADKLRRKVQELDNRIDGLWSEYRQEVLARLTPEQRQQYKRFAVGYGLYGCRGYGMGYGRGMGRHLRWERGGFCRRYGWEW